jgi:hypothetical protein
MDFEDFLLIVCVKYCWGLEKLDGLWFVTTQHLNWFKPVWLGFFSDFFLFGFGSVFLVSGL